MRVDESDISAYLDGEIEDDALRTAVEAELAKEPGEVERLRAASALLREDMETPNVHEAIMRRAERHERLSSGRGARWFGWVMTAVASILIVLAVVDYSRSGEVISNPGEAPIAASAVRIQGVSAIFGTAVANDGFDVRTAQCVSIVDDSVILAWRGGESFGVFQAGDAIDESAYVARVEGDSVTVMVNGRPIPLVLDQGVRVLAQCRISLSDQQPAECMGWALGDGSMILLTENNEPIATARNANGRWYVTLSTDKGSIELTGATTVRDGDPISLAGKTADGANVVARLWLPVA